MRVTLKTIYASVRGTIAAGETAELPDAEAKDLIEAGYATETAALAGAIETTEAPKVKLLEDMTRAELEERAKAQGVDISGARTKADAIALLNAPPAPPAKAFADMSHDELIAAAADKSVDITGAADDAAIVALLSAAQ